MKKLVRRYFIWFFFLPVVATSCDPEVDATSLNISPFNIYIPVQSNEVVSLEIGCEANFELSRFLVMSQVDGGFSSIELDSSISGTTFSHRFQYKVPLFLDSTTILLDFSIEDIESNVYRNAKMLEVSPAEIILSETTGHEFFSAFSDKQDAYNLFTEEPLFQESSDSSILHIADVSISNRLERKWVSPAGFQFVKFNDFDYANCTNISVRNAFEAGSSTEFADNLIEGDILLLHYVDSVSNLHMAIKIVSLFDEYGTDSDRYIFNLKK